MKYVAACLTVLLMLFFAGAAFAQDPNPTTLSAEQCTLKGDDRIVPNILGFSPAKAERIVRACGFKWDGATDVHTLSYEAIGTVGDQEPSGGTVQKKGTVVRGFISVGLYPPDFTGWDADKAERFYRDFRHGVNKVEEWSDADPGTVIAQDPKNAELYNSGLPLTLNVSKGPKPPPEVTLKLTAGMRLDEAIQKIKKAGLVYRHGTGYDKLYDLISKGPCFELEVFAVVTTYAPSENLHKGDVITVNSKKATGELLDKEPVEWKPWMPKPPPNICPQDPTDKLK